MKKNRRLREKLAEARKENLFLKKAAAFFAKGIDERHIDSSMNIGICSASGGCCDVWKFIRMLITITESTDAQKRSPKNGISCIKFKPYIMKPTALSNIAGGGFIWYARASIFLPSQFISI